MTRKLNQNGSGIVVALLAVLVIAVVGGVGFFVYSKSKDSSTTSQTTASTSESDSTQTSTKDTSGVELSGYGLKVNDPDGRGLQVHAEKVCTAQCATEDSYFIRDNNDAQFSKCQYPAGVTTSTAADAAASNNASKFVKKIGDKYYYVFAGSNFQSPCGDDAAQQYQQEMRQYVFDNLVAQ